MVKDHSDSEKGNPLPHIGYSYRLAARVLLYAPSHRQDNTYHGLCYTSRGALAGTRNSSMGPPHEGSYVPPQREGERCRHICNTYIHALIYKHTYTYLYTDTYTYTQSYTLYNTHAYTNIYIHTHIYIHT